MTLSKKSFISLNLAIAIGLSSCANIQNDQTRTKTEGTLTGAAVGTALGTGIAAIATRGDKDAMLIGAVVGGAIGGLAGHSYGSKVAARKAEYANQEAYIQSCIAELQSERRRVASSNLRVRQNIALQKQELDQLLALRSNNQPTSRKFVALNRSINSSIKTAHNDLKKTNALMNDHVAALQEPGLASGASGQHWKQEYASLNAERSALEASINSLNQMQATTATMIAQTR